MSPKRRQEPEDYSPEELRATATRLLAPSIAQAVHVGNKFAEAMAKIADPISKRADRSLGAKPHDQS